MTPDELVAFERELQELIERWAGRPAPDDGRHREPVFVFAHGVPAKP